MEQKLLEPSYKSQWQYKVLDLNTHKINDQVGIQHAYIIRFLQLKKKTHPILCRTPCQVSSCINPVHRQKLSAPNGVRLPLPLVLDLEVEHDEPPQPQGYLQCCMIHISYLIPPPNPSNSSILRRPAREILAAFHWVLVPPTRLVSAKVANVPGWGVLPGQHVLVTMRFCHKWNSLDL